MKLIIKPYKREDGTEFYEVIDAVSGFALAHVFNERAAEVFAAAPELLEIAKAYRNLLRTMAHTDGEVATFHHIQSVIAKAEGNEK